MTDLDRVVAAEDAGTRIDVLLSAWLDEPRGRVQQRVDAGLVTVDGEPVAKSHRVAGGARVVVSGSLDDTSTRPAPPVIAIRYEDDDIAVVNKPAGLVVHAGAGTGSSVTLVEALVAQGVALAASDDPDRPGIVHRLDRGTSGLLVVAKTAAASTGLVETFKRHDVDRRYWALVDGVPSPLSATINAPIGRSGRNRTKFTVAPDGRAAVTHYDVEESFGRASVLTVRLETGRTHQVRVHLAAVGHPVAGDGVYGASSALTRELGLNRPALHARRLGFEHPVTGERIVLDEPLPEDLAEADRRLRA